MADDARVQEIDALFAFAGDLSRAGSALSGVANRMVAVTFEKESELYAAVERVNAALDAAAEEVDRAEREYDDYVRYTDEEDFSPAEATRLQDVLEDARDYYGEVAEDAREAEAIRQRVLGDLLALRARATAFAGQVDSLAMSAAGSVDRAAHALLDYKSVK